MNGILQVTDEAEIIVLEKNQLLITYHRLSILYLEISDELDILQAVEGLGFMYDSTLYRYWHSLRRKLRRIEKILKIQNGTSHRG
jgi:hypothetical protein